MLEETITLNTLTGQILEAQKRTATETAVQTSGGHGSVVDGTDFTTPVHVDVKTATTTYDTVFIQDDEGREHAVEFVDFRLMARAGNQISIVSANGPRAVGGRNFLVYNHSTGQHFFQDKVIRDLMRPSFRWAILNAALLVLASAIVAAMLDRHEPFLAGVVTALGLYWIGGNRLTVGWVRGSRFLKGGVSKDLVKQLAGAV